MSIVTHKVQTTRAHRPRHRHPRRSQIVFVDTPGIFAPRRRLDRAMVTTAWGGAADADLVLAADRRERGLDGEAETILDRLAECPPSRSDPVLNKVDGASARALLDADRRRRMQRAAFARTFMVSALTGDGLPDLLDYLAEALPAGPWLYPEDQMSDLPLRQLAAEITREKLYLRLHQELPYSLARRDREVGGEEGRLVRIEQIDLCRARQPEEDRARQGGRDDQGISGVPRRRSPRSSSSRCTSSCSSRCARTGATTPSATARWAWNSRLTNMSAVDFHYLTAVLNLFGICREEKQ